MGYSDGKIVLREGICSNDLDVDVATVAAPLFRSKRLSCEAVAEFRCASPEGDAASNRIPTQPFLGEMCDGFGKVGLITGGGGGIGRTSSLGCARRGAKVVVDLDPPQGEASAE